MAPRKEEYVLPDGTRTQSRSKGARYSLREDIRHWATLLTPRIPAGYFVATAERESGRAFNEVDTEESGFVSWGLFQVSMNEADDVGLPGVDLLDPEMATRVFVRVAERNLDYILKYAPNAPKPDVYAYLCIAHNEGLKAVKTTIQGHGLDWSGPKGYAVRNITRKIVAYGNAILEEIARV